MSFLSSPSKDPQLRKLLLDFYIESQTAEDLADWLRHLGVNPAGSVQERRDRVRSFTKYLDMPEREFPAQTQAYLTPFSSDALADLCLELGVSDSGARDNRYCRIMREIGFREGWLRRVPKGASPLPSPDLVAAFLQWYPIVRRGRYEKDYYDAVFDELSDVFGEDVVHEQLPVAHGTTLKIDFHLGHPQAGGIGIEVKMPTNNSEIQRGLGQIDQYLHRYGSNLIMVVIPDFLNSASLVFFRDQLRSKGVRTVIKATDDMQ